MRGRERERARTHQVSGTSNETVEPAAASQPAGALGASPVPVNMAGHWKKGEEIEGRSELRARTGAGEKESEIAKLRNERLKREERRKVSFIGSSRMYRRERYTHWCRHSCICWKEEHVSFDKRREDAAKERKRRTCSSR